MMLLAIAICSRNHAFVGTLSNDNGDAVKDQQLCCSELSLSLSIYIYGTLIPSHKSGKKWGKVSGPYAVCRSAFIMYTYVTFNIILQGWWTAKIIVKERFNVSLSFTAKIPSLKSLDRSFTNYIIIWPRKKHYVWDWNLPGNRVKARDLLPHFLLRSYRSTLSSLLCCCLRKIPQINGVRVNCVYIYYVFEFCKDSKYSKNVQSVTSLHPFTLMKRRHVTKKCLQN